MLFIIKHLCGHEVEHDINKVQKPAIQRAIKRRESRKCLSCHYAAQVEQSEQMTEHFPDLEGTPLQIAWAKQVRAEKCFHLAETWNKAHLYQEELFTTDEIRWMAEYILTKTDAGFWIDNNDKIMGAVFVCELLAERKAIVVQEMEDT